MPTTSRANLIARAVISQFNKLPAKRKPTIRDNGLHEWVPLSGIVAEQDGHLTCLALATGMKCLPASKLQQANGNAIHDWHAEVLAMRSFNRFLLDECRNVQRGQSNEVLELSNMSGSKPFRVKDNIKLHMYCSEAPCGDASMELIMAAQEDASPWDIPPPPPNTKGDPVAEDTLPGRAYFSQLGIVRRKPARGDAPPTLSKSCSDKITLKQCTSLLSSLASLLINPSNAYIETLVLPESEYSAVGCERAFSRRVRALLQRRWSGGYKFSPFAIETTEEEFEFSRKSVRRRADKIAPSNLAAAWTCGGVEETILGGVLQGRKPFDEKGASKMSRRMMWLAAREVSIQLDGHEDIRQCLSSATYQEIKDGSLLAERRHVKQDVRQSALTGWVANQGDSAFSINTDP
ncbi:hypothetical protein QQS21_010398 [Conoideocrella luteorostrata]|uniref:A to I editase domain-containing protein n=1 Tax=Conoideocrella luteorostrata TaxID=1105319 RepID=A0AAJ0FWW6_9HYPO|nr:hypothetical protein QQS21_010398 [Conoideocrella luteorostrata]